MPFLMKLPAASGRGIKNPNKKEVSEMKKEEEVKGNLGLTLILSVRRPVI